MGLSEIFPTHPHYLNSNDSERILCNTSSSTSNENNSGDKNNDNDVVQTHQRLSWEPAIDAQVLGFWGLGFFEVSTQRLHTFFFLSTYPV